MSEIFPPSKENTYNETIVKELITQKIPNLIKDYTELFKNDSPDLQDSQLGKDSEQDIKTHIDQLTELNNLIIDYRDRPHDFKICTSAAIKDENEDYYRVNFRKLNQTILPDSDKPDKQLCLIVKIPSNIEDQNERIEAASLKGLDPDQVISKVNTWPSFQINIVSVSRSPVGRKTIDHQAGIGLTLSDSKKHVDVFALKNVGTRHFKDFLNINSQVPLDQFNAVTKYVINSATQDRKKHQTRVLR